MVMTAQPTKQYSTDEADAEISAIEQKQKPMTFQKSTPQQQHDPCHRVLSSLVHPHPHRHHRRHHHLGLLLLLRRIR